MLERYCPLKGYVHKRWLLGCIFEKGIHLDGSKCATYPKRMSHCMALANVREPLEKVLKAAGMSRKAETGENPSGRRCS